MDVVSLESVSDRGLLYHFRRAALHVSLTSSNVPAFPEDVDPSGLAAKKADIRANHEPSILDTAKKAQPANTSLNCVIRLRSQYTDPPCNYVTQLRHLIRFTREGRGGQFAESKQASEGH